MTPDDRTALVGPLPAGHVVNGYELRSVIAIGGFGIVYEAWDPRVQREVAIKEYMPTTLATRSATHHVTLLSRSHQETFEAGLKSFINEARLLGQLDHEALAKVYQFWEENGTAYMAMPRYRGRTLKQVREKMPVPPDETWLRNVLGAVMGALKVLHAQEIYHRDIAPDNILLRDDGRPLVLDLGAARRVISDMTQTITAILKPNYAPVEQYAETPGLRQGAWTDIYALGATWRYLITGKPPTAATARAMHDEDAPLAQHHYPHISPAFCSVIDAMLSPRPQQRPQSIAAVEALLARAIDSSATVLHQRPGSQAQGGGPGAGQPFDPDRTLLHQGPVGAAPYAAGPGPGTATWPAGPAGGHPATGYPNTGFPQTSHPTTGYPSAGQPTTGHPSSGHPAAAHPSTGYPTTGYPAAGAGAAGYPGPGPGPGQGYPAPGTSQPVTGAYGRSAAAQGATSADPRAAAPLTTQPGSAPGTKRVPVWAWGAAAGVLALAVGAGLWFTRSGPTPADVTAAAGTAASASPASAAPAAVGGTHLDAAKGPPPAASPASAPVASAVVQAPPATGQPGLAPAAKPAHQAGATAPVAPPPAKPGTQATANAGAQPQTPADAANTAPPPAGTTPSGPKRKATQASADDTQAAPENKPGPGGDIDSACGGRILIARDRCLRRECAKPANVRHPECERVRGICELPGHAHQEDCIAVIEAAKR